MSPRRDFLWTWGSLAIGLVCVACCVWTTTARVALRKAAIRVPGTVMQVLRHRAYFYPIVVYADRDGTPRTLRGADVRSGSDFVPGQHLSVLYVPSDRDAEARALIDEFWQIWEVPLTQGGLGIGWLAGAWLLARLRRPPLWRGHG